MTIIIKRPVTRLGFPAIVVRALLCRPQIGTWDCECRESQTCLTSTAVIPTSLEDGAIFYASSITLLLETPPRRSWRLLSPCGCPSFRSPAPKYVYMLIYTCINICLYSSVSHICHCLGFPVAASRKQCFPNTSTGLKRMGVRRRKLCVQGSTSKV